MAYVRKPPTRPLNHSLVKALRRVPDFAALDDRILLKIVGASANLFWHEGSVVFERDTPSEALYIVLAGCVRISNGIDDAEAIAQIGPGDYFGELSMLANSKHTKSARAIQDTELMVLPKSSFEALLRTDADLAAQVRSKRAEHAGEPQLS